MDKVIAAKFPPRIRAKMKKMRSDGATITQIANEFETTPTLVRRVLEG